MSKLRTALVGVAATAILVVPATADAAKSKRVKKAAPLITLKLQVLQGAPCAVLGTEGSQLFGRPIRLCI